jgi:two-component system, sensor histidine kinase
MVVDDEPDTVITLLELLRGDGYDAEGFASGKAALDKLAEFDPDVIISDIAMPNITGWDVAKAVRERMGERRPVLIAISGQYTGGADKVLAQIKGFNYYLVKPCDPTMLLSLLGPLAANLG